jgi:hypothetical protein
MATTSKQSSLATWNDGPAKSKILDFVARVTEQGGPDWVPPAERIATFDNDGTLWCEQPLQAQVFFLIDRVKELAAKDPTLKERQPFKALLELDLKTLMGLGKQAIFELAFATHSGMREDEFEPIARNWLAKTRHPKFGRLFKENTYQRLATRMVTWRCCGIPRLAPARAWRFSCTMTMLNARSPMTVSFG